MLLAPQYGRQEQPGVRGQQGSPPFNDEPRKNNDQRISTVTGPKRNGERQREMRALGMTSQRKMVSIS